VAIERVSANDETTLATDRGPAPMNIGVLLRIEGGSALSFGEVRALMTARLPLVPRLRQRLQPTPPGCGRAIWVDAPDFDIGRHLEQVTLGEGEGIDNAGLLSAAATFVCTPLPRDRPLWAARWVTGLEGHDSALVLAAHHCLADGLGGLAVLAALCDEGAARTPATASFPSPVPRPSELAGEAWRARAHAARRLPRHLADSAAGVRELVGTGRPRLAARTSLNRPTGAARRLTCVTVPLHDVVDAAHARDCTVNDLVLSAVVGALGAVLRGRGEQVSELIASVPVSDRRSTSAERLGNHTGVMPLAVPLVVDPDERLRTVASLTSGRKGPVRGASSGPLGLAFRALARLGVFQVFIDHQRLVHTFVTNVKGPAVPWHVAGHRVTAVIPVAVTPGNVGVSFDILSYAGQVVVTLVADPAVVPDQDALTALLAGELAHVSGSGRAR
jgi:WS/DGAT/MGAT family acyltransferase